MATTIEMTTMDQELPTHTPNSAASDSMIHHVKSKGADYEKALESWLEWTAPAFSIFGEDYWFLQTFTYGGAERVRLLIKLVSATRSGDATQLGEVKQLLDKTVTNVMGMLNTITIISALFLVLLYTQIFNPAIYGNLSLSSNSYFSHGNIVTFQCFFYGLLNLSFALFVYLIITNFRKINMFNFWLESCSAKIDYLAQGDLLFNAYMILVFAILSFLFAIPFAFALLVSPASGLASMLFYVTVVPLCFMKITCDAKPALVALRDQAKAALGLNDA